MNSQTNTNHLSEKRVHNNNYQNLEAELSSFFSHNQISALRRFYFINPSSPERSYTDLLRDDENRLLKDHLFHNSKTKTNYILVEDTNTKERLLRPIKTGLKDKVPGSQTNEDVMESTFTNAFKKLLISKGQISNEVAQEMDKDTMIQLIFAQYLKKYINEQVHIIQQDPSFNVGEGKSWVNSDILKNEYKLVQFERPVEINNELYFYANIVKEHLPKEEIIWKATLFTHEQIEEIGRPTDISLRKILPDGLVVRIDSKGQILDKAFQLDTKKNIQGDYISAVGTVLKFFAGESPTIRNQTQEHTSGTEKQTDTIQTSYDRESSKYIGIIKFKSSLTSTRDLVESSIREQMSSVKKNFESKNWTENNSRTSSFSSIPEKYHLREALVINSQGKTASEVDPQFYPAQKAYRFVAENHGIITQFITNPGSFASMDEKISSALKDEQFIETYVKAQNIRTIISKAFSELLKTFEIYKEGLTYPQAVQLQKHIYEQVETIISDYSKTTGDKKFYDHWIIKFTPTNDQLTPAIDIITQIITEDIMSRESLEKGFDKLTREQKADIMRRYLARR